MSTNGNDPLRNPKDPFHKAGPEADKELFRMFSRAATGFPTEPVINAACNVLINAIRQGTPDWKAAEKTFDEFFGKSKQLLKNHYDANGRKRGVFPYNQVILPPFHNDSDKY